MRSILAVANNTLKQALRMKIALVFIALLLLILPIIQIVRQSRQITSEEGKSVDLEG